MASGDRGHASERQNRSRSRDRLVGSNRSRSRERPVDQRPGDSRSRDYTRWLRTEPVPDHIELLGLGIVRKAYVLRDSGMVIEDHTRAIGPAYSDPRYEGGPCRGRHQRFIVGESRFGRLYACEKCDLTLKYVPWMTSEEVEESTDPVPVP